MAAGQQWRSNHFAIMNMERPGRNVRPFFWPVCAAQLYAAALWLVVAQAFRLFLKQDHVPSAIVFLNKWTQPIGNKKGRTFLPGLIFLCQAING